ncbi:MAG: hypothetical protein ACOYJC_07880 [Christensenellales bacterium]|jgi:hypothetical protein
MTNLNDSEETIMFMGNSFHNACSSCTPLTRCSCCGCGSGNCGLENYNCFNGCCWPCSSGSPALNAFPFMMSLFFGCPPFGGCACGGRGCANCCGNSWFSPCCGNYGPQNNLSTLLPLIMLYCCKCR